MAWVGTEHDGVTPNSGSAGDAFTFDVEYWSVSNNPPTTSNLLVDLNGDGTFASALPLMAPPPPRFPPGAWIGAGAGLLALALASRMMRRGTRLTGVGVALVFVAGCSLGVVTNSGNPVERIAMLEVDSADTVFSDGKLYTIQVTLGVSGAIAYRFDFSDGAASSVGYGASPRTVAVN